MKTIVANVRRGGGKTPTCLLAAFLALAIGSAWAADSININLCQGTDNSFKVSSTVSTLIGDIPAEAWSQSTTAGNGTITTTTGYDGTSTITLSGTVSIQENVDKMGNHGQDTSYSHQVLKSWLATKDNTSHPGTLTISNIPFTFYDVIVIMSGATGTTGGFSGNFAPLTITAGNKSATKFAGGNDAENYNTVVTDSDSGWGSRGQDTITYGTNALRVNGLAGTLTISYTAYAEGIAGVQIIDSTAEHFNIEEYALTHNDGYVRDGVTYNYIFRGTDATYPSNWGTCSNWYTRVAPNADLGIAEEFWSPYALFSSVSSKNAPQVGSYGGNSYAGTGDDRKSESPYSPALVDGALIDNFDPNTPITMSFCEGWEVKMGVYGGAKVEVNRINKLQSNEGTKWFRVGEGSKITVKAMGSGTVNNDIKFYVAEPAGFEWQCALSGNSDGGTFKYYLSGDGSVKFSAGLNRGTHKIRSYTGALSEQGDYKKIVVKTLIEMGEGTQMTKTVSFSDATVTFGGVAGTAVSGLALSNDVGSYEFSQDASGAYISYVDYSDEDMGWNVEPGETLVISEAVVDNRKVICDGSFTITGTPSYTVNAADLAKLDFSDVTGTVTLGDYTCYELDTGRTLPAGYVFGAGSAVAMTETVAEYMQDRFSVSGLTGVSTVMLTRYDGTITNLVVTEGSASRGDGSDIKVTGAAALYDFTFTNIVATATGSRNTATMGTDGTPVYDDGVGVVPSPAYPYIGISAMHSWTEFSTVVVGKMPSDNKKCFISFGRGWNNLLFLATGSKANEVVIGYGNSSSVEVLATMTVPHAAESRHLYAFTISENKTKLTIYLDGMKWKTVTRPGGFALATSDSTPGIQIGKGYATNPSGYGSATDGVFYSLLIYDYVLSKAQLEALTELYPYSPSGGSYSRSVSGETTFATEGNTWTKSGDAAANYAVPAGDSAITLTAGQDASVAVNATLSADSLTLDGSGSLTLKKGDGLLTSAGLTTIATDVTIEAGAADISGAPTVFGESGSLCFDYSAYDLFAFTGTRLVPLTGEIEEQAEGVVTCLLPDGAFAREHTVEFLYTNGCYQLLVTCRDGRDVYLAAGTTRFEDGTPVIYYEEVPAEPEGFGDPELVPHECYAIAADTVHFLAADMVTVARTCPVTGYDFGDFVGTLVFASADELILNTTITGAGRVKVASGVVQSRGSIATDIDVDDGAILKLGSVSGFGATSGGATPSGKAINITGTVELNGVRDSCNEFTLNGGTLRNTGAAISTGNRQTTALALTANSTVHAGSDFGLVGSGYGETSLELDNYTLTKTGSANFWLYNTRSTGAGVVDIQEGTVYAYSTVDMPNVNFKVAEGATLKIRTDSFSVGTISGVGTVDFGQNRPTTAVSFAEGSSFDVKIVLASTTESSVRINYTGPQPNSVTVCEPSGNWDVVSTAATVSHEPGCIVVTVDVADTRRRNPAVDGDQATFTNIFMGDQDATWETIANWKVSSNNRWADYGGSLAPCLTDSNFDAVLFDGDLMKLTPGADGYKSVGVTTRLEGWTLRVGLFNHVKVSAIKVKKQQNNCFYMVDATSKLIMNENNKSGYNGGKVTFYVAAKDGVEFTGDFDFGGTDGVEYYFKGEGSVNYTSGNTHGSHAIKGVASLPLGKMSATKRIFRHKLVSFSGSSTKTYATGDASVTGFKVNKAGEEEAIAMTVKSAAEEESPATLDAATDDVGTCVFVQDSTGVYIDYVGYSAPFFIYLR